MNALLLTGPRTLEIRHDYPEERDPGPGETLIQVRAVGICGSDLHLYQNGDIGGIGIERPFVPGHEFMGEVLAVGPDAIDGCGTALMAGLRVAVDPHVSCGGCLQCKTGNPNLCPNHWFMGLPGHDGAMRERMIVPSRNCFPLPESISDAAGALLEPLGVCIHAIDLARPVIGEAAVVIGCGAIGLILTRLARLAGHSPVVAIDPVASRATLARDWGATHVIPTSAKQAIEQVSLLIPNGAPLVLEAAWAGPAAEAACCLAAPGGRVILVGIPDDDACLLPHSIARRKGLTLRFSRRMKHTYPRAVVLASGNSPEVPLDDLASHKTDLTHAAQLFDLHSRYRDGLLRGIVRPWRH